MNGYFENVMKEDIIELTHIKGEDAEAEEWYFEFYPFENKNFKIKYITYLQILKVINVFYIHHEYEIENTNENSCTSTLDSFREEAYSIKQKELELIIKEYLINMEYRLINEEKLYEDVLMLENNQYKIINGEKKTIGQVLFNDEINLKDIDNLKDVILKKLRMKNKLIRTSKELEELIEDGFSNNVDISKEVYTNYYIYNFKYKNYIESNNIKYSSNIYISSILPIYYIEHKFEIGNKDCELLTGIICFDGYIKEQFNMHEYIKQIMNKKGYKEIINADYIIAVLNQDKNTKNYKVIKGETFTLGALIMYDMLDVEDYIVQ